VYKVVQWYNDEGLPGSALLDIFDIMPGLPITAMEISKKVRSRPTITIITIIIIIIIIVIVVRRARCDVRVFNGERVCIPLEAFERRLVCDFPKTEAHMAF